MKNNEVTWYEASQHAHDASGITNPENYVWHKKDGIYYPSRIIDKEVKPEMEQEVEVIIKLTLSVPVTLTKEEVEDGVENGIFDTGFMGVPFTVMNQEVISTKEEAEIYGDQKKSLLEAARDLIADLTGGDDSLAAQWREHPEVVALVEAISEADDEEKPQDTFSHTSWNQDDIKTALIHMDAEVTPENILLVRDAIIEGDLIDAMIPAGWDYIHNIISELQLAGDEEEVGSVGVVYTNWQERAEDNLEMMTDEQWLKDMVRTSDVDYKVDSDSDSVWIEVFDPKDEVLLGLETDYEATAKNFKEWAKLNDFYGAEILSTDNSITFSIPNLKD